MKLIMLCLPLLGFGLCYTLQPAVAQLVSDDKSGSKQQIVTGGTYDETNRRQGKIKAEDTGGEITPEEDQGTAEGEEIVVEGEIFGEIVFDKDSSGELLEPLPEE